MGTTWGYLRSIHAREIWALVACFLAAMSESTSSRGRLASMFSFFSWGTHWRTSSPVKVWLGSTLPERYPLAMGEKATKPMLCSWQ